MTELLLGISLGWAADVSPGPLLALVVTTTLQRGARAGLRVALTPLITDAPIVTLGVLLAAGVPDGFLLVVSTAGAAYLVWLGVTEMRAAGSATLPASDEASAGWTTDVRRGVLTNLLSPHPWLFWVAVGAPILVSAWQRRPLAAVGFLVAFFAVIVGTKAVLAVAVGRGRRHLTDRWYRRLVFGGGAVLAVMGVVLLFEAWTGPARCPQLDPLRPLGGTRGP